MIGYHPNPDDYWRWTHAGLARLLQNHGGFGEVVVHHNAGTASAITYLVFRQLEILTSSLGVPLLVRPATFAANVVAWRADRLYARMFPSRPPDLCVNYLAVAHRPAS